MLDVCSTLARRLLEHMLDTCSTLARQLLDMCSMGAQRPSDKCHGAQRSNAALLNALPRRPVEPRRVQRSTKRQCQLPSRVSQHRARTPRYRCDDESDNWPDVCSDDYRAVVQLGKDLWRSWALGSSERTTMNVISGRIAVPESADNDITASQLVSSGH